MLTRRPPLAEVGTPPELEVRVDRVRVAMASVARYAAMCGFGPDEARAGRVPVTYPHVLAMPLHLHLMGMNAFPLRPMGLIHLSNMIELPGRLEPDTNVDLLVGARNYRRTDAGLAFDMTTMISHRGEPLWRETCVFLSRDVAAEPRRRTRPLRPPKAPKDSKVLEEIDVGLRTAWDYARVSGDFNPIHLDDRAARLFGLRGAISHGMWSLARSLAAQPTTVPPAGARLETQFLAPVQLPARVCVRRWTEEGVERRALCDVRTGRVHMHAAWEITPSA